MTTDAGPGAGHERGQAPQPAGHAGEGHGRGRSRRATGLAGAALGLAGLAGWLIYRQPRALLRGFTRIEPSVVWYVETSEPMVALTIDDGPCPEGTPRVLDVLAEHGARATFFMVSDNLPGNETVVRRLVAEGHEIGNHMTSDRPSIRLSAGDFENDLLQADAALREFAHPRWYRPGSGWLNRRMVGVAREHGYRVALGSNYPLDAKTPSVAYSVHKVAAHSDRGSIIILHDGPVRGPRTAQVLGRALPMLRRRGLRVVTLSELYRARTKPAS